MADEPTTPIAAGEGEAPAAEAPLTVSERSLVRRLSTALRFADFMAVLMVAATGFSAFATWRMTQLTRQVLQVSERPYLGMERVSFDATDGENPRLMIDCRNFGSVSGTDGVARFNVVVDGRRLTNDLHDTIVNIGMVSPSVPHPFYVFVPLNVYQEARAGRAKVIVQVQVTYRGPDQRGFCYHEIMTYDYRSNSFNPNGGDDKCDREIY